MEFIKHQPNGNKREQKRQSGDQLWQKNGNCCFATYKLIFLGIVRLSTLINTQRHDKTHCHR